MAANKRYKQNLDTFIADPARNERISTIRSDLNKVDNTNTQEQQKTPEKAREKLIPCPRRIDGTPFIEYAPGYLIHQDNFEDYVSGALQLPTEERQQVDAEQMSIDWEALVAGRDGLPWTLEGWHFKAVIGTTLDDPRLVHHP
ncbi:hypothetical protein MHZ90_08475 [Pantoea sp. ACRSH]|uniref:hypothetical protein n=1 Tax=unclassified Pantoea TaxID=2630326 RepID=UPI001EF5C6C2|nr:MULTISPECIES: hypothetical protein [unclassified Pantoea]MCG7366171.1 hypothetical protein [Pantoea sp. ACRSH]MCG7396650.1 hypothetical protein [Pantoea sp. ACRSC]